MNLHALLMKRVEDGGAPVRAGLIGAGKFGTMFLAQAGRIEGLAVPVIADLDPARARRAAEQAGWPKERIAAARLTDDAMALIAADDVDVVVDATGDPAAGLRHALAAAAHGKHIVMVNVEADVLAGPLLAERCRQAGVVYSLAYGDQPALICEQVDWARATGFEVVAAGKGTKYLPAYHTSTPDTVWGHYGLSPEQAAAAGMSPRMFNSFLDGTKSAIEMAAVANATGLAVPAGGLAFPPAGTHELAAVLGPSGQGGVLERAGQVEVVSCLRRDGSPVDNDLRWGVYVVFDAGAGPAGDYAAACFREYGMITDPSGRRSALWRPYHLIGLELTVSVLSAALRGEATGAPRAFRGDVVAVAKRALDAGESLDGEGGHCVWGRLMPAADSVARDALPIGLAHGVKLTRPVAAGAILSAADVALNENDDTIRLRRDMIERHLA